MQKQGDFFPARTPRVLFPPRWTQQQPVGWQRVPGCTPFNVSLSSPRPFTAHGRTSPLSSRFRREISPISSCSSCVSFMLSPAAQEAPLAAAAGAGRADTAADVPPTPTLRPGEAAGAAAGLAVTGEAAEGAAGGAAPNAVDAVLRGGRLAATLRMLMRLLLLLMPAPASKLGLRLELNGPTSTGDVPLLRLRSRGPVVTVMPRGEAGWLKPWPDGGREPPPATTAHAPHQRVRQHSCKCAAILRLPHACLPHASQAHTTLCRPCNDPGSLTCCTHHEQQSRQLAVVEGCRPRRALHPAVKARGHITRQVIFSRSTL